MSKQAFAQTVISKVAAAIGTSGSDFSSSSASSAMAAIASGISEYIVANTSIAVSYKGMIPGSPPVADPLIADSFKVVGVCAPPSPSNSFDTWVKQIETNIMAGFQFAPSGKAGVVMAGLPFAKPGLIIAQANITTAVQSNAQNLQLKVWEVICGGVMDWINSSAASPMVFTASNRATLSVGTASIVKITIT